MPCLQQQQLRKLSPGLLGQVIFFTRRIEEFLSQAPEAKRGEVDLWMGKEYTKAKKHGTLNCDAVFDIFKDASRKFNIPPYRTPSPQLPETPPGSNLTNAELLGMVARQIKYEPLRKQADSLIKTAIADAKMDGKTTNEFLLQLYGQVRKETQELSDPLFFDADNLKACIDLAVAGVKEKQEAAAQLATSKAMKPEPDLGLEDSQEISMSFKLI